MSIDLEALAGKLGASLVADSPEVRSLAKADAVPESFEVDEKSPAQFGGEILAAAKSELQARKVFGSLSEFVRAAWVAVLEPGTPLEWNWHHETECQHVQWQLEERVKAIETPGYYSPGQNLAVNVPPRSLKTNIISICGPAWAWLHWPGMRVRALSVNPKGALDSARSALRLLRSPWYRELVGRMPEEKRWSLVDDAATSFNNDQGGSRVSAGLTAQIVGEGADWLIIDDPNDPEGGEKHNKSVNSRYDKAIANRVNHPRSAIRTLVQQRTGEDDLTGHVTDAGGWAWLFIQQLYEIKRPCSTPMPVDDENNYDRVGTKKYSDPRRVDGEKLHPERFDDKFIAAERARGQFYFASQHQQRPAPEEGGMFKKAWFKRIDREDLPKITEVVISLDPNAKKTATGSRAALVAVARGRDAQRFIVDAWAERTEVLGICVAIKAMIKRVEDLGAVRLILESTACGPAVEQAIRKEMKEANIPVTQVTPKGDKVVRARAVAPTCECLNVQIVKGLPMGDELIHEVCVFPNGSNDDLLDALSQALSEMVADSYTDALRRAAGKGAAVFSLV